MSEYSGLAAAERLIGNPEGEPSDLIKRVRQQPFVVLLLDEIEKASPQVFDVLLSLFDEGRLTDRFGRATTFRSAVIIMTSNLGADKSGGMGFDNRGTPSYAKEALSFFRPEFFNRIDEIVRFGPLGEEEILKITRKELSEIAEREGLKRAAIRLSWSDRLVTHLAKAGFDPKYGARPLQRTIETLVVAPLARRLVEGVQSENRDIHLNVDEAGKVVF
jgi:ATP-dependent Clp protease ATP-binding subunit ClpC